MTYKQALNFDQKWTAEQAFNDLERYLLREEKPAYKAVAIAMQALEKQMTKKPEAMTNYDRIKNMSIEEMAKFLPCPVEHLMLNSVFHSMKCKETTHCEICCKEWLESEVESE